jgi:diaminopimelate decarboxylase
MPYFHYKNNELFAEGVALKKIAAQFGTPTYVYSRAALENHFQAFHQALDDTPHRICYAVKANSNLAILNVLARLGSGFDIVSVGELERVLKAGGEPGKIVFSGVGKKPDEILRALEVGIYCFNVESEVELTRLNELAEKAGKIAPIALRINPNIDARTHPYISTGLKENKFGIAIEKALPLCREIKNLKHIKLIGIACHIGSQLTEISPFVEALERVKELAAQLRQDGIELKHLNIGGGLGVRYQNEEPPSIADYVKTIAARVKDLNCEIILEPGRAISANAGILLSQVEYLKHTEHKNFAVIDAAMNDLMRPALYNAWQNILAVTEGTSGSEELYDVVGPVCETGDFLGRNRTLALTQGSHVAICSAGAYGFSMSSNYNSRPRAAEVMVDGEECFLIRPRETVEGLFASERVLDLSVK